MNSQSVNSQSLSERNSASREETQIEHFKKMSTTSKFVTVFLVLIFIGAIGGGVYWYTKKGGKLPGTGANANVASGIKKLTDSA
jgi:hypothetical protein